MLRNELSGRKLNIQDKHRPTTRVLQNNKKQN